ncbi:MAG: VIT1/CCC1 transporter family protein [Candidatus Altiarchaeota archaeon]
MFEKYSTYARISKISHIARRYFIMNAFDGALTMLGVIVGAFISGLKDPMIIVSAGIAGSVAMGISGFTGAFMTERAERMRELRKLERKMLSKLDNTVHGEASRFAAIVTALVDGISPALAAIIILSPFIAVNLGFMGLDAAFRVSLAISALILFSLGAFLARISYENVLVYGVTMLMVGLLTVAASFIIARFFGSPSGA